MFKIEDVKIKDYRKFFETKSKSKRQSLVLVINPKILITIFLAIFSLKVVAAPLSLPSSVRVLNPEVQKQKESLEQELQKVLKEIENYQKTIQNIQNQKRTIQSEIQIVETKIKKIEAEIVAINLNIQRLNKKISETKKSIKLTEEKVAHSKEILVAALRYYYQFRQRNVVEVFLAGARLSDYFNNIFYLQKLQEQINQEINNLKELSKKLNNQKVRLEEELNEQNSLLALSKIKYSELRDLKNQKQVLLAQAQKQESEYKRKLTEAEKTAAQIREQIYRLAGGGAPITFGEAYEYAKIAEKYTGIRPAFLLAILHYESRIGQNVGTCHYKDAMKPSEQPIFEQIVTELGLDPNKMPVSCKPWYGWGGAMGPAQFIPSTWMAYRDRVSKITGNKPPSPWNILDSFIAAALKLTDNGAGSRTYQDEWKAAMIYFAGSNWNKPSLRFYGDDVMAIAQRFEADIRILEKNR